MGKIPKVVTFRRLFEHALRWFDKIIDITIWLHHSILLYICLVWLLPLLAAVLFSWLVWDLRPLLKGHVETLFWYAMVGYPLWFLVGLYAEFSAKPLAVRLKQWMEDAPVQIGYIVLGLGALFWLFGVF